MITVSILINGKAIYTRTAINITPPPDRKLNEYALDTGEKLFHNPNDGAVVLAKKMLDTIKER